MPRYIDLDVLVKEVESLEQYSPKSAREKNAQADLLRLIGYQIDKEKKS